jgi:hypothetical protein
MDENDRPRFLSYVLLHGVLLYGVVCFVVASLLDRLLDGHWSGHPIKDLVLWLVMGFLFGAVFWRFKPSVLQRKR